MATLLEPTASSGHRKGALAEPPKHSPGKSARSRIPLQVPSGPWDCLTALSRFWGAYPALWRSYYFSRSGSGLLDIYPGGLVPFYLKHNHYTWCKRAARRRRAPRPYLFQRRTTAPRAGSALAPATDEGRRRCPPAGPQLYTGSWPHASHRLRSPRRRALASSRDR